ncbi:MAG: cobyric acid synthase [Nocardioidaceae bacterium]
MAYGGLLVAGTSSDAGKSVLTTGLCRVLARRGLSVAPFKAQNMSNNSMVTAAGTEIGRAQWIQAVAARTEPETAMNPVLLKPGSDGVSHLVVSGRPAGRLAAQEFTAGRRGLAEAALAAFDDLRNRFDVVVCEGAGSPAEINLRAGDFVNMGLARHGGLATVLVGDIDRGGVFASLYGTLGLLDEDDRALIAGFVLNKFRGDRRLLDPAMAQIRRLTGRPFLGVLPWLPDLWLDSEDSLALADRPRGRSGRPEQALRVVVVLLPRVSNFTDVDPLLLEPEVEVTFADSPRDIANADVVVLPGTRSTVDDLHWMRDRGLDRAVLRHVDRGGVLFGICGGFQILGECIDDPVGMEGPPGRSAAGLGLLQVSTVFGPEKVLRLVRDEALGVPVTGYEIHHGRVERRGGAEFLGGARSGRVFGTMWHGVLESDAFRSRWLTEAAADVGLVGFQTGQTSFAATREARIDAIADALECHLDIDAVAQLALTDVPPEPTVTTR